MNTLGYLTIAAILVTAILVIVGIVGLYRGGEFNRRHGTVMMRARVVSQGVALVLLVLFLLSRS
ncbi:MAG: HIG1 domain-containing protein [Alphaproteobacteria bacterium]